MKRVYTAEDRLMIYHLKNVLEQQGIDCMVKNDSLSSVIGEIPFIVAWPELWVIDGDMEAWAKELIKRSLKDVIEGESWTCQQCGEEHSSQFTDCWNCQSISPTVKPF